MMGYDNFIIMQSNIDKVATALSRRQRFPELRNEKMKTIETGM